MTTSALALLLQTFTGRGIVVQLDGDALRVKANAGAITPDDLASLRERRADLLAFLEEVERVISEADTALEQTRRRIAWTESLRLENGRDARPALNNVLAEYSRLLREAREQFDVERIEEIVRSVLQLSHRLFADGGRTRHDNPDRLLVLTS